MVGAEPGEHGLEALTILVGDGDETQAQAGGSFAALDVTNDGIGFDAAFLNEEVKFGGHAFFQLEVRSLDEEPIDADVEDAGDIVPAIAAPADPDVF